MMKFDTVFVASHRGMVGAAIVRRLQGFARQAMGFLQGQQLFLGSPVLGTFFFD